MRLALATLLLTLLAAPVAASPHEPVGEQSFLSPQSNPIAVSPDHTRVYVANTTSNTIDVIDTLTRQVIATIPVGLEPVSLAFRPDGRELWVSNHVSDSVSIIDTDPGSLTLYRVVDTIQTMDASLRTTFDEPVGIAFASNAKAYVALSSRNLIAVIDVSSRKVTKTLKITAQDPRAITVADGKLFVIPFESHNKTSLSACPGYLIPGIGVNADEDPEHCTVNVLDFLSFLNQPNLPGRTKNIIVDDELPDRDLFIFDTATDELIETVDGLGTLLYGIAADSKGNVFVTNTDARNHVNGIEAGEDSELPALGNRMFDNQISRYGCVKKYRQEGYLWWKRTVEYEECGNRYIQPLDALNTPAEQALATPYAIAISGDDQILVATAAGSSRLFTMNAVNGKLLASLDLGEGASFGQQIPRGLALVSNASGAPQDAYVLNTLENTVSVVDVRDYRAPKTVAKISVGNDPTLDAVRRGRIAFNNAFASDSGNFSCASCHPDGHTDQLLWRIGGACFFDGTEYTSAAGEVLLGDCSGFGEPRSTMPIRGLRNTVPLHWDGVLGDPFGGRDGAVGPLAEVPPSCNADDADGDHDCFLDLVDESLSAVMCDQAGAGCATGPSGRPGRLTVQERDDMAALLASVSFPPARSLAANDALSDAALRGVEDFFLDKGTDFSQLTIDIFAAPNLPKSCGQANCHTLPLLASTNSSIVGGFDAPSLRGLSDRWLHFSNGITFSRPFFEFVNEDWNSAPLEAGKPVIVPIVGFVPELPDPDVRYHYDTGFDELTTLAALFSPGFGPGYRADEKDIFQMSEEFSTGLSGATGRQVTLNARTTNAQNLEETETLLDALEAADRKGVVNLRVVGTHVTGDSSIRHVLSYRESGLYENEAGDLALSRADLIALAQAGDIIVTATAHLRQYIQSADIDQPLLVHDTDAEQQTIFPILPQQHPIQLGAVDVRADSFLLVDGQPVEGSVECVGGSFHPTCSSGRVSIRLAQPPSKSGLHILQLVSDGGLMSNPSPFCVNYCDAPDGLEFLPATDCGVIKANHGLGRGQIVESCDGQSELILQGDGNLVLYRDGEALWASNTKGSVPGAAVVQADGNFTIYDLDGSPVWYTGTWDNPGAHLTLQDDGNLVLHGPDGRVLWNAATAKGIAFNPPSESCGFMRANEGFDRQGSLTSCDGRFRLSIRPNGELVLDESGIELWSTGTAATPAKAAIMQADGNFVLYDSTEAPLWHSQTHGSAGAMLVLQDDGNLVIYGADSSVLWSTDTWER